MRILGDCLASRLWQCSPGDHSTESGDSCLSPTLTQLGYARSLVRYFWARADSRIVRHLMHPMVPATAEWQEQEAASAVAGRAASSSGGGAIMDLMARSAVILTMIAVRALCIAPRTYAV